MFSKLLETEREIASVKADCNSNNLKHMKRRDAVKLTKAFEGD